MPWRRNMNVLVFGGSGFVGQAIRRVLPDAQCLASRQLDLTDGAAVMDASQLGAPRF